MEQPVPAPPAAPETPAPAPTISATRDAANKGDFLAFDSAHLAAKRGAPLARVEAPPAAVPQTPPAAPAPLATPDPAPPERTVSKRQQAINDYERRIAEQDLRIRDLEARFSQPPAARTEPAPPAPPQKAYDGTDASDPKPRDTDFETHEAYLDARDEWNERRIERKQLAQQRDGQARVQHQELTAAQQTRVEKFVGQLDSARNADPEFVNKLTPEVRSLKPFAALAPGEAGGPLNVVAEQVYDSPIAPQVLVHFSQHPEALQRFQTMPPEIQALPSAQRARAHIQWIVKEFGKLEAALEQPAATPVPEPAASPISNAPPPPPMLTKAGAATDPKAAALARGDFATFERLDLTERAQKRGWTK